MKNHKRFFLLLLIFILGYQSPAQAQFDCLETPNLRLIYMGTLHSFIAPHVARCFENSYGFHRELWQYQSPEKVTVSLFDNSDYGNAGAGIVPENRLSILIAPQSYAYETMPANERMNATMNHELAHIVCYDQATGTDNFFRTLFSGKVRASSENPVTIAYSYLTTPRVSAPRWYHEGIAVSLETWMCGGLGRSMGAYDEMVFRTMVRDDRHFYDPIGLESEGTAVDFQVGVNSYLYGTRFASYLILMHGTDKLISWYSRKPGSKRSYTSQFKKTFGVSLSDEWNRWIEWERQFQKENLEIIRQYPTTPCRYISEKALGSVSRACYDARTDKIYAAVNFPGQVAHLTAIDVKTGKMNRLKDVKGPALYFVSSIIYDSSTATLFYTTDNNDWRDLVALDVERGTTRKLIKDVRIGDLAFNPVDKSIWGIRHYNGISTITRIPHPYNEWNQVYSWPYGKDMYDLDISPDGKLLTGALAEINGRQTLISLKIDDLMAKDSTYTTIYDFGVSLPANFTFSGDGQYLHGSSYLSGVSNIFRYDFVADSMEAVSNCETGLFRPVPYSDDSLLAFRYTAEGFVPVMIPHTITEDINAIQFLGQKVVEGHPLVKDWMAPSPSSVDLDSLITYRGKYYPIRHLSLASAYPVVKGYKQYTTAGMRLEISEPIGFHCTDLTVTYTPSEGVPTDERWHAAWNYNYLDWNISVRHNDADFYDLFGPTKTSRKGNSAALSYRKILIYDLPKTLDYRVSVAGYGNLERMPEYQNITTSYDKFLTYNFSLNFKNMTASLGAVDYEKGYRWQLLTRGTYVNRKLFPHFLGSFDFGFPLFIPHTAFWIRSSAGYCYGRKEEPFANFFFGGFGNNWVDYRPVKRYRQYYAFPGMELNSVGGGNFGKVTAEITLPAIRFRRLGIASFYFTWIRTALFASGVVTNMHNEAWRREVGNVGIQSDIRIALLFHYRVTLSLGYAAAFEEYQKPNTEFMASVRIL